VTFTNDEHANRSGERSELKYRPDVDGLRAVAVLCVLFYHLGFSAFRGGFVGVDVFFVISGFLITRLIRDEYSSTGAFSFKRFYVRRVRRLVPAQLFITILCTAWAAWVLAPPHLKSYGGALASTVASSSNFFFWSESGYFNTESAIKPLLHTWSLGVEEQFYLVWPAALYLALRSKRAWNAPMLLVLAGVVSLALNQVFADGSLAVANRIGLDPPEWLTKREWFSDGAATIFYLLPFRVFEFAIGALLVWLIRFTPRRETVLDACVVMGLALIAYATLVFDDKTIFPSFNALVPCIGAALCIYAGQARRTGMILRNRPAVAIGLMSYSLYLVHWPLIVFWRYGRTDGLSLLEKTSIMAICLAAAACMLKLIEQPFRKPSSSLAADPKQRRGRGTVPSFFAVAAVLAVIGANMWSEEGWAWRFSDTIVAEEMKFRPDEFNKFVWRRFREIEAPFSSGSEPKMLIIGDSMAADFTNIAFGAGLNEDFEIRSIPILDSCQSILPLTPEEYARYKLKSACPEENRKAAEDPNWRRADVVVVAFLWNEVILDLLRKQMGGLRALADGATFVVVGPKGQEITGVDLLTRIARADTPLKLNEYRTAFPDLQDLALSQLRTTADAIGVRVFDVSKLFCSERKCLRFNEFGNMLIYDDLHLTPKGAEFVGRQLRNRLDEYPYFKSRAVR